MREMMGGELLARAARRAGFVMGFEYCQRVLLGELKGGAR